MRFKEIFSLLIEYGLISLVIVAFGCGIFLFSYYVVYLRLMKGKKRISIRRLIIWSVFIVYLFVIIFATLFSRVAWYDEAAHESYGLLSSYRSAWFSFSIGEWRNIILNIAMFMPLGILIPMASEKLRQIWKVVGIGFGLTAIIECIQFITNRGVFEMDDILNNTLGTLIGYGLFKAVLAIKNRGQHRVVKFIGWLSPLLATVVLFVGIFTVYDLKEFGNMPGTYTNRQNMSGINLSCDIDLSDEPEQAMVYNSSGIATEAQTKEFAEDFFKAQGAELDEERTDIYDETAIYYGQVASTGETLNLWVNYSTMTYSYTDFSNFDSTTDDSADETLIRTKLSEFGIAIPEDAKFSADGNGNYSFTVPHNGSIQAGGELTCTYYKDGTIKDIENNLFYFDSVRNVDIISESQAYQQLAEGCFVMPYLLHEPSSIRITSLSLEYKLDTKGYYMPVYVFGSDIDGTKETIMIPAYK